MRKILVTGATGMLGKRLLERLVEQGYELHALVRKKIPDAPHVRYFLWNVEQQSIDPTCIEGVDTVLHLAGQNIGKKPWSQHVRTAILKSRTESIALIYKLLEEHPHQIKQVIASSGTGYYGHQRKDELLTEDRTPSDDFLGQTCFAWELAVAQGRKYGLRTVSFRCGVILNKEQGILPKIASPIKLGLGAVMGNGKQYMPWIHLDDAVNMYIFALERPEIQGVYNMVAPEVVTNRQFNETAASVLHKPLWLPPIPAFVLRSVLGKMSHLLLDSTKVSPEKIMKAGYQFQYPQLRQALSAIFAQ